MFSVNLLVRWPWNFGYFFSIILHTVCAFFPNASELGSSYSLIIVSLIVFSNDFSLSFFPNSFNSSISYFLFGILPCFVNLIVLLPNIFSPG